MTAILGNWPDQFGRNSSFRGSSSLQTARGLVSIPTPLMISSRAQREETQSPNAASYQNPLDELIKIAIGGLALYLGYRLIFGKSLRVRFHEGLRQSLYDEFGGECYYCARKLRRTNFHVDHFKSLWLGGTNDRSNLVVACTGCNLRKGTLHGDEFLALYC